VPEPAPAPPAPRPPPDGGAVPRGVYVQSDAAPFDFVLEPETIDLGVLRPDESARCTFEIVNRDRRPLDLLHVDGSCDCVGFEWRPGDVPPGGRRRVDVVVSAENRGNKVLDAFVQARDREVTTRHVSIRYAIEPDLEFLPLRADFGQRIVGTPAQLELSIRYRLPEGVAPLRLAPKVEVGAPVTIELGAVTAAAPIGGLVAIEQPLLLRLDAAKPVAPFRGHLEFAGAGYRRAVLPVTGAVHGGAWIEPAELHLGVGEIGGVRRGTVRLRWTREPVDVEEIACSSPDLTAQALRDEGARSFRLQVEFKPSVAGEFTGDVTVRLAQLPDPLVLRVRARVR